MGVTEGVRLQAPPSDQELIEAARRAARRAYVPYSRFRVGAAVVDDQNRTFTGCNIENASYGASVCAERTALFKAVSEGAGRIKRLALVCDQAPLCMPCGICRQVLGEFAAEDFVLLAAGPAGAVMRLTLDQLLPHPFKLD